MESERARENLKTLAAAFTRPDGSEAQVVTVADDLGDDFTR